MQSQLYGKRTEAYCREIKAFNQQLNNGRVCHSSYQCKSMVCGTDDRPSMCSGMLIGEYCNSHADCNNERYCKRANQWPWMYECAKMRTSYE